MEIPDVAREWPLVARSDELRSFRRILRATDSEGCVIHGMSGVGKSRLAAEFWRIAQNSGTPTRKAIATVGAAQVPFGALAHLLPADLDPEQPVRAFQSAARSFAGSKGGKPVLWLDDLDLLDTTSVVLLRQLLDAGTVFLVATVRSETAPGEAISGLAANLHRFDLDELSASETATLLEAALGAPVSLSTQHHLFSASRGNPLYLRELVHGTLGTGALSFDGEVWHLAETHTGVTRRLRDLVQGRLLHLPPAARHLLEALALCEQVSEADAVDMTSRDMLQSLEGSGLLVATAEGRRTTVALAHPVYGEVLRDALPTMRRRTLLQEQIARTRGYGSRRRGDAIRLASWELSVNGTTDPALLVKAAAFAAFGNDNQQVVTLLEKLPARSRNLRSDLLLGNAQRNLGAWEEAETAYARANRHARSERELLMTAGARTFNLFWSGAQVDRALAVNDEALTRLSGSGSTTMLLTNKGHMLAASGDPVRGLALLSELPDRIDDAADPVLWLLCATWKAAASAAVGRTARAIEFAEHAVKQAKAAQGTGDLPHPGSQALTLVMALSEAGRFDEAAAVGAATHEDVVRSAEPMQYLWLCLHMGRSAWMAGRPGTARRLFAEALAMARARRHTKALQIVLSGLAASAAVQGDTESAAAALRDIADQPPMGFFAGQEHLGEAWLLAAQGRLSQARSVLMSAARSARDAGQLMSEGLLLTDVARLGAPREVSGRLGELADLCDGRLAPARARLAAALADQSPGALSEVSDECDAMGAPLLAAEAMAQAGTAWQLAGEPRRSTSAAHRALALAGKCEGAQTPALVLSASAAALTKREAEIAHLAAATLRSREIAELLTISVRTVDNHLQSIYAKLGVTNRRELARKLGETTPRSSAHP
ncbi:LuxR C-terminal-related transcriptional regulator [Streptomyces sp. NPDC015125]|uniref:LuxR C-terminal-related transcriptional regulator n=1 Tax=Streptomyces sp. NPDC015125 TaxID=3364938 RepID=UPI0036FB64ED